MVGGKITGMVFMVNGDSLDYASVFNELLDSSDRAVAVVGGALVDELLGRALKEFMRQSDGLDTLFKDRGPLSTFSSKIDLGYYLGCYGTEVHQDLNILRKLRNNFAHDLDAKFANQSIADRVSNFSLARRYAVNLSAPDPDYPVTTPDNLIDYRFWIGVRTDDLQATFSDPKQHFLVEIQTLVWAISATHGHRTTIGRLG